VEAAGQHRGILTADERGLTLPNFPRKLIAMPDGTKLSEFVAWCAKHITGDEKGEAQLFLERLFQAFGNAGLKEVGATLEFRVVKDTGGTAFADLVYGTGLPCLTSDNGWNWRQGTSPGEGRGGGLAPDVIHIGDRYFPSFRAENF
jgi:hypothetical protein